MGMQASPEEVLRASLSRRTVLLGVPALGFVGAITAGCGGPVVAAASNPAVQTWFLSLSAGLGANITTDVVKYGPDRAIEDWTTVFGGWLEKWGALGYYGTKGRAKDGDVSPVLLVRLTAVAEEGTDPLSDQVGVIINHGANGVLLDTWAWQTLAMFSEAFLEDRVDAELAEAKALLAVSLMPSGERAVEVTSPGNLVAAVTYVTAVGGYVELARVEEPDHTHTGRIKISGIPDQSGQARVQEFVLPVAAAEV
ncbi:hypothetical protein [Aquipuribacter sp. MA13-6]|uniref:hypothetical protein n=1 Tax=unclassified Aquipuribacter TaxID=2635084 RepID=UPI003EE9A00B